MIAALRTEYRKLVTTRMWWLLLLTMALYLAFIGATMAFAFTAGDVVAGGPGTEPMPSLDPEAVARTVYSLAAALGYVFPVAVGALSVTAELRHQTLTPTFLAEPRRGIVLTAKMLASVPVGLVFGLVGTAATVLAAAGVLAATGSPTLLDDPAVLGTIARTVLTLTLWCVVGVGFGAALPSQVVAVVVLLAFTQLVEPLLRVFLAAVEPLAGVGRWLPGAAGEAITGASLYSEIGAGELLSPGVGLLVLLGYGLLLALVGRFTTLRRDLT